MQLEAFQAQNIEQLERWLPGSEDVLRELKKQRQANTGLSAQEEGTARAMSLIFNQAIIQASGLLRNPPQTFNVVDAALDAHLRDIAMIGGEQRFPEATRQQMIDVSQATVGA